MPSGSPAGGATSCASSRTSPERYDLFNPRFYIENIWHEWRRYGQIGRGLLSVQPGAWLLAISGLIGLHGLWRRRTEATEPGSRVLLTAVIVGAALFALGLRPKVYHYLAALWPLLALTAAVGLLTLLGAASRALRVATIVMMMAAAADGMRGWNLVTFGAASVTSYRELCDRLARRIPPDSRVLALPAYWFGLEPRVRQYRSLFGPMLFVSPPFASRHEPLATLLDEANANVIVLDPPMLTFLNEARDPSKMAHAYAGSATALQQYVAARSERVVTLDDPSYGHFEIHFLRPWRSAQTAPPSVRRRCTSRRQPGLRGADDGQRPAGALSAVDRFLRPARRVRSGAGERPRPLPARRGSRTGRCSLLLPRRRARSSARLAAHASRRALSTAAPARPGCRARQWLRVPGAGRRDAVAIARRHQPLSSSSIEAIARMGRG